MPPCNQQHGGLHYLELKENRGLIDKRMAKLHEAIANGRKMYVSLTPVSNNSDQLPKWVVGDKNDVKHRRLDGVCSDGE